MVGYVGSSANERGKAREPRKSSMENIAGHLDETLSMYTPCACSLLNPNPSCPQYSKWTHNHK